MTPITPVGAKNLLPWREQDLKGFKFVTYRNH